MVYGTSQSEEADVVGEEEREKGKHEGGRKDVGRFSQALKR